MRLVVLALMLVACGPVQTSETSYRSAAAPSAAPAMQTTPALTGVERCLIGVWTDRGNTDTTRSYTYNADHTYRESMIYSPLFGTGTGYDLTGTWQLSGNQIAIAFSGGDSQETDFEAFRKLIAPKERDAGCDEAAFKALVGEEDPSLKPYHVWAPHQCWYAAMKGPKWEVRLVCDAKGDCECLYKTGVVAEYHITPSCTGGDFSSSDVAWKQCYAAAQ